MNALNFMKTAVRDYRVGAITPSSRFVVSKVLAELKPEYSYVVEYGAGDGVTTKEILKHIPPHGKVMAVELNENFLSDLEAIKDSRLIISTGDVRHISKNLIGAGLPRVDAVVSSIPFSFFKSREREEIIKNTHRALTPGGSFIVYQYSPMLLPMLRKYFSKVEFKFEPLNIPPCFIMTAVK